MRASEVKKLLNQKKLLCTAKSVVIDDRMFKNNRHTEILIVFTTMKSVILYFQNNSLFRVNGEIDVYTLEEYKELLQEYLIFDNTFAVQK